MKILKEEIIIKDILLEQKILSLLIHKYDSPGELIPFLEPNDFYDVSNRELFVVMRTLYEESKSINEDTIIEKAKELGLDRNVNLIFLNKIFNTIVFFVNLEMHRENLVEISKQRKLQIGLNQLNNLFESKDKADSETILNQMQEIIYEVGSQVSKNLFLSSKEVSDNYFEKLITLKNRRENEINGLSTGFESFDVLNQGLQPTELMIIAARPAMGKTAFALNIAINVAKSFNKKNVAFFSFEMSPEQLMSRVYSILSNVSTSKLKNAKDISDLEWVQIANVKSKQIDKLNLFIDDSGSSTLRTLVWKCRRWHKLNKLDLIVIDYLQLISLDNTKKSDNRQNEVATISRTLKLLAKELNIPIIALSQLSREVEKRQDKQPMLADLRESGAIEQDADIVAFLYRENYYNKATDWSNKFSPTKLIVAKNRSGPLKDIDLTFDMPIGKFIDEKDFLNSDTSNNK
ncbi:replicative DNA helicase [Mycoplasma sp. 744]|uniref:replicative DNA helicase n=1 Tax=Mycoplasma sp. 744 TaxID=3108531 RepID=UPI002B1D85C2|nr:replicative DNA helicase [Mycoplasma sp. 744]MEA4115587.1 replicative DNA helicase [Mycoplasma sp. 744]